LVTRCPHATQQSGFGPTFKGHEKGKGTGLLQVLPETATREQQGHRQQTQS
jgi:hypothetical protein